MTKRLLCAALLAAIALPMYADFNTLARAIDQQRGIKRIWMPGLGLARFLVWVVRPKGVHDFQLVTFEGGDAADPHQLQAIMRENVGPGFTPLVRVWSKKSSEWSFVYARMRPNNERVELIVLAHDDDDTVLVRVEVNATTIARELQSPRGVTRWARQ